MTRLALIASLGLIARIGAAQPTPDATEQAKQLFAEGSLHYAQRDYRAAVEAFRRAYAVFPDPQFLFNIAQAYRKLDDCEHAREHYSSYLRQAPAADNRAQVERLIATMDACVEERAEAAEHAGHLRLAGVITAAAGAAVAAGGVYFSIDASRQARAIERQCDPGCFASDVAAIDRRGFDSQRDAIVLYAVGGAAIAAGLGLVVWSSRSSHGSAAVAAAPGGATVTVVF